ncbi:MAG: M14 family zinc carboxypeptidase, partial [bacterium]
MRTAFGIAFALALCAGLAQAGQHYDLVTVDARDAAEVRELEELGCIVNGPGPDGRTLVEVPVEQTDRLAAAGWSVNVLMRDVTSFYEKNGQDYRYHTYTQIKDSFMLMAQNNPTFVKFETLGLASNDSLIFALKITDNPLVEEDEPELMYEAAIHGDEKCATEPAFEFAVYLIRNYGVDPNVTYWVNTREIWVLCPTNPYGHIAGVRSNRNGYDCNRDYGFMWWYETSAREPFTQRETQVQLRLMQRNAFNYWQSGHGGTYFISTPWSYSPYGTRDSMEFWYLGGQYHNITGYPNSPGYRGMYRINGASKDYAYGAGGAIGWTVETCIYKTPPVDSLAQIIAREHTAMKMILANIDRGIRGIVTDSVTGVPIKARVRPMPINFPSFCDSIGDFHRYLRPGTYSVLFEANGYHSKTVSNVVVTADTVTRVNVALAPDTAAPLCLHQFIAGRGVSDVSIASTPDWALGPRDGRRFSLGRGGFAIYDFGRTLVNSSGSDFTVYEDDGDPEGYRIEVANDWAGPWTVLGRDTGTASFDLAAGGVGACRYVKVVDDSGATSGSTAGFDLEAIEAVMSNAAAVVYQAQTVLDSPPGGNNDGKLDPGETADLVLQLGNVGRQPAQNIVGTLSSTDTLLVVLDATANYGTIQPDSSRANWNDHFRVRASANTPREYRVTMRLALAGTGYADTLELDITVGELRAVDPIPDGPRQPARFWAYDDVDTAYAQHPQFGWVEINGVGTRLTLSDDQTSVVSLPSGFGPWR